MRAGVVGLDFSDWKRCRDRMSYFLHPGFGMVYERNRPKSVCTTGEKKYCYLLFLMRWPERPNYKRHKNIDVSPV